MRMGGKAGLKGELGRERAGDVRSDKCSERVTFQLSYMAHATLTISFL